MPFQGFIWNRFAIVFEQIPRQARNDKGCASAPFSEKRVALKLKKKVNWGGTYKELYVKLKNPCLLKKV